MDSSTEKPTFLFVFSQAHSDFRQAEFDSVCQLSGISPVPAFSPDGSHLQLLQFPRDERDVQRLLSRAMLVKHAFALIDEGRTHEDVLRRLIDAPRRFASFDSPDQSWCMKVRPQGRKRNGEYIQGVLQRYASTIRLERAPIDLSNPQNVFTVFEMYKETGNQSECVEDAPTKIYFARFLGEGQGRLKTLYSLHQRRYIGNSTMDPELAFIQANLALARPGAVALDPFCGTGGLIIHSAYFGSFVIGVEIKWDVARAKGKSSRAGEQWLATGQSIRANFSQYGLDDARFLGVVLADSSRTGLWYPKVASGTVDLIITDPPYGIREKGQRLGKAHSHVSKRESQKFSADLYRNGLGNEERIIQTGTGFPEKQNYAMSNVFLDLMDLAAMLLRIGGRLAFWFPICISEYSEQCLPRLDCLSLVHNCKQQLAKDSARRLLVYEKLRHPQMNEINELAEKAYFEEDCYAEETFRQKVFNIDRREKEKEDKPTQELT